MSLENVRDIAVVALAAVWLVATLMMVITGVLVWRLIAVVRADISPILRSARSTVETVQDTVETVGDAVKDSAASTPRTVKGLRRAARYASWFWR